MLGEIGELESVMVRFFGGSSLESHSGPRCQWFGNGSLASCITNPSMTCVSTFGLIMAFGRPPLSVLVPVLLCGSSPPVLQPVVVPLPVLGVVAVAAAADWVDVGVVPAAAPVVVVVGVAVALLVDSNPLALTTAAGVIADVAVTVATLVASEALVVVVVVIDADDESELVVVAVYEALLVVVVCGAVVVVLTAPAGSSDEATAGCPADAAAVDVDVVVGVMDRDADAVVAAVGVAAVVVFVAVVVVVKGAGDEVSIGVGPFNCASDALSAAAAVFWTDSSSDTAMMTEIGWYTAKVHKK